MRIAIRVKPGSARPGVGGEHDGALVVRVSARAVDGKATEAALAAVAGSFGVRRSAVRLVSGASSRTKIVEIDADDPRILAALLAAPGRLRPWQDAAAVRPSVMSDVLTRPAGTRPRRCRPRTMRFIPPNRRESRPPVPPPRPGSRRRTRAVAVPGPASRAARPARHHQPPACPHRRRHGQRPGQRAAAAGWLTAANQHS